MPRSVPRESAKVLVAISIAAASALAPGAPRAQARLFSRPDSVAAAPRARRPRSRESASITAPAVPRTHEADAEPLAFQHGDSLAFALADGRVVRGTFAGTANLEATEYARRYRAWRATAADSGALPEWDEQLRFPDGGLQCVRGGRFAGVDPRGIAVRANEHARIERARFEQFRTMFGAGGGRYASATLSADVTRSDVPWRSALRLRTSAGEETVAIDDVSAVGRPPGDLRPVRRRDFPSVQPLAPSHTQLVAQGGVLDFGIRGIDPFLVVGMRVSPARAERPGPDVSLQYAHNEWSTFLVADLAASGILPLGPALAIEPRLGPGLYVGGGWIGTWNLGLGVLAFPGRHLVVRVDYTRHVPMGVTLNRDFAGTNMVQLGIGSSGR